jgi:hypothetical protein
MPGIVDDGIDQAAAQAGAGGPGEVTIHRETLAALRLLAQALQLHPDDAADLEQYGGTLPAAVADAVDDLIE